jgi:hypothetical protein
MKFDLLIQGGKLVILKQGIVAGDVEHRGVGPRAQKASGQDGVRVEPAHRRPGNARPVTRFAGVGLS